MTFLKSPVARSTLERLLVDGRISRWTIGHRGGIHVFGDVYIARAILEHTDFGVVASYVMHEVAHFWRWRQGGDYVVDWPDERGLKRWCESENATNAVAYKWVGDGIWNTPGSSLLMRRAKFGCKWAPPFELSEP